AERRGVRCRRRSNIEADEIKLNHARFKPDRGFSLGFVGAATDWWSAGVKVCIFMVWGFRDHGWRRWWRLTGGEGSFEGVVFRIAEEGSRRFEYLTGLDREKGGEEHRSTTLPELSEKPCRCRNPVAIDDEHGKREEDRRVLDYDGTLSPIVDDPDLAFMSEAVHEFVKLNSVYYAGSHGMDIMAPPRKQKSSDSSKYQTRTLDKN
ncbi:hypothetical protein Dimus_018407, partial [Dionaea muscipula]